MVQHFIDSTLPAHDPNFLKPRGLIAVPPEVAEQVANEEGRLVQKFGGPVPAELRQRLLGEWTLNCYDDDAYIAYRRTSQGVEVLAVGHDEISKSLKDHPLEMRRAVLIGLI